MAGKTTPLGIGLAIDFGQLDKDLGKVADHIENVGKTVSLKVGSLAGLAVKGDIGGDQMAAQVAQIGIQLSQGMASGVRTSNALMLSFGARINSMLDRLAGTAITIFSRIDAAMKFPMWDTFMQRTKVGLFNFAKTGQTGMSNLDKAMAGSFGKIAQTAARIMVPLFQELGKKIGEEITAGIQGLIPVVKETAVTISASMTKAASAMSESMLTVVGMITGKFQGLDKIILQTAADAEKLGGKATGVYQRYGKFAEEPEKKKKIPGIPLDVEAQNMMAQTIGKPTRPSEMVGPPQKQFGFGLGGMGKDVGAGATMKGAVDQIKQFNAEAQKSGGYINLINQTLGPWGRLITVPVQGFLLFNDVLQVTKNTVMRLGAFLGSGLVAGVQGFMRIRNFVSSFGAIHTQTYHKIFEEHGLFVASIMSGVKSVQHLARGLFDLVTLRAFRRVGDDASNANKSIKTTTGLIGKLIGSVGRLGVEMAAAFGVIGVTYKLVQFFQGGVKSAADLNAEVARSKVVFGASFGAIEEQAEKNTKQFKISKAAQLDIADAFGSMAQGAGVSEEKSAGLANELTSLAVDMTGLGVSFSEVSEAMKTGLSGRAISLKQFSVNIDENTTKAFAWSKGIARTGQELTLQQTLMARAGQIMQGMSYAQGALTANANQAAVQFQAAGGSVAVFAERMGELLLPAIQEGAAGFTELMGAILTVTEGSISQIKSWGESIKGVFSVIGLAVRNSGDLWKIAQLRVNDFVTNALAYMFTMPENLQRIWKWLGENWRTLLTDMINAAMAFGTNLATNFMNLGQAIWEYLKGGDFKFEWTPLLDGFKAATAQLPELIKPDLVSSQAKIDEIYSNIGDKEQKLKEQMGKPILGPKQAPIEGAAKTSEYKLGGALEAGSKEAQSAISKGQSGRGSTTDAVKQGVTVQKDIAKTSREHLEWVKAHPAMPALTTK